MRKSVSTRGLLFIVIGRSLHVKRSTKMIETILIGEVFKCGGRYMKIEKRDEEFQLIECESATDGMPVN